MELHVYLSLEIDILKTLVIRFSKIILTLKTNLSVRWTQVCYGWLALINNWQPLWCMVFLWWGLSLYSNPAHPARAYPSFHVTWRDEEYHYSPLEGMLVHVEVPPHSISSDFPDNLLLPIYTPGWRAALWGLSVFPRRQHIDLVKVKNSSQKILPVGQLSADSFCYVSGQSFGWLLANTSPTVGDLLATCR